MATTRVTQGETDRFRISNAINKNADALDDQVVTGTWTPVLTCVTPGNLSITYTRQYGTYHYIADEGIVFLTFRIVTSAFTHTTASGQVSLTGIPFTSTNDANIQYAGAMIWQGITKANYTMVTPYIIHNATQIIFPCAGSGQSSSNLVIADMPTGGSIILSGSIIYHTGAF